MFYLRLNKVKILNNREFFGKAEVQFLSFVNSVEDDFPSLTSFFETDDQDEKKLILDNAIKKVLAARKMTVVNKVKDRHELTFGTAGYVLYSADEIPDSFSWAFHAIELDGDIRSDASIVNDALKKAEKTDLVSLISNLSGIANAPVEAFIEITKLISSVISSDKDDQIGFFLTSFIRSEDYPHGIRNGRRVPDLTNNMFLDYTIFGNE